MNRIGKFAGTTAATLALAAGLSVGAAGAAGAESGARLASKSFTWGTVRAGDCTMFSGARWTLYSDGTAYFDGTVTSGDDGDAWLMWARLKDSNGAVLTALRNVRFSDPTDQTKFVKGLPSSSQRYRWFAKGEFNPDLYPLITRMSLAKHC
jgi:hypothetical protein